MKKGFSLLETTVALAVLLTSVVGPLTLASFSLRSASVAKNSLIAAGLAQEGFELVRTARSSNVLKNVDWLTDLGFCLNSSGCTIDAKDLSVGNCGAACQDFLFDLSLNLYNYETGDLTNFSRKIKITETVAGREIRVDVTVSWKEKFGAQSFDLSGSLFNW